MHDTLSALRTLGRSAVISTMAAAAILSGAAAASAAQAGQAAPRTAAQAGPASARAAAMVRCHGTPRKCWARVSLAGGASNRRIVIRLTGRHLRLHWVQVRPRSSRGAYNLSHGHYTHRRWRYAVILNAVQGNPRRAHLTLHFRVPVRG